MGIKQRIITLALSTSLFVSVGFNINQYNKNTQNLHDISIKQQKINTLESNLKGQKKLIEDKNAEIKEKDALIKSKDTKIKKLQEAVDNTAKSVSRGNITRTLNTKYNFSKYEMDLFYRVVYAESGNESYEGQLAVANVILNRIKDKRYPDTLKGVVYQKHQFESVSSNMLYDRTPSDSVKKAVQDAINGKNNIGDCISFWATYVRKSHPLWDLPIKYRIGVHVFTNAY